MFYAVRPIPGHALSVILRVIQLRSIQTMTMSDVKPDNRKADSATQPAAPANPSAADESGARLSQRRRRLQLPLFVLAVGGLVYAAPKLVEKGAALGEWYQAAYTEPVVHKPPELEFDLTNASIPRNQISSGGPPKDGIPALTDATFVTASRAKFLKPDDRVIGVTIGREAKAYPLKILNYHEVVNDRVGGRPLAVTYCPLCDSVAVFDSRTADGPIEFGVSGLLYNSNVLLYDRSQDKPESLWSQMMSESISGPRVGQTLLTLPVELTAWSDWRARHPDTSVLSPDTGHRRNYSRNPYAGYFGGARLMFPVQPVDTNKRLPPKAQVLGVWAGEAARAYPLSAFAPIRQPQEFSETLAGRQFTLHYDPRHRSLRVIHSDAGLQWMYAFWFAWYAFHPETELFQLDSNDPADSTR